ncbi:MAG: citrate synthase [Leptospirales bacterium]|nr:citrate synthase [Leptospirales bacterium]
MDGKSYEFPIVESVAGPGGIDFSELFTQSGRYSYDPSLNSTAVTQSSITWVDPSGKLHYRGYDVADLVERSSFVETSYLLAGGELPSEAEYEEYSRSLSRHSMIHESMRNFFDAFPGDAHPLAILATMVTALSSYYPHSYEDHFKMGIDVKARLLAKVRTLAAWAYKKSIGQPVIYPRDELPYCSNFLNMMFAVPSGDTQVAPEDERILNQILILYSDHEQNVATSTVVMVGSTRANLFVSINAGISAIWGQREANYRMLPRPMLQHMISNGLTAERYFEPFLRGEERLQSPAFGHRKYRIEDPRAILSRRLFKEYIASHPRASSDPIIQKALEVESYMLGHPFFQKMKLYPNLDFYSAMIFHLLGIPPNMNNVIRVIGKMSGWLAHWQEQRQNEQKGMRPQQIYSGSMPRTYPADRPRLRP